MIHISYIFPTIDNLDRQLRPASLWNHQVRIYLSIIYLSITLFTGKCMNMKFLPTLKLLFADCLAKIHLRYITTTVSDLKSALFNRDYLKERKREWLDERFCFRKRLRSAIPWWTYKFGTFGAMLLVSHSIQFRIRHCLWCTNHIWDVFHGFSGLIRSSTLATLLRWGDSFNFVAGLGFGYAKPHLRCLFRSGISGFTTD